ncbi:hypothetical protein [Streptomyces sp. A012304]|uniref:hypothetical protein n=1 Tax=Streptomyces sp. A012304 TaxID=375446 RepID=UPI0022325C7F|nr:hypothetical protein [Streptomyces sp. A012304]GKQ37329.1 hypothetical protein ALMP_38670 [Streptomyces sp. A012304]
MTDIRLHDVDLVPERTLGAPADDGPLRGRLTFGWDLLPADHAGAPADWLTYLRSIPDREFRQLVMVCSFRPETPEGKGAFRHASLGVALSTPDGGAQPIARLIDPGERTRPVGGPGTGLNFTVTTGVVDVGVERPPGGGPAREEWIVRGHGASQPNPQWEFRRVKRFPLVGDHPVAALVELVPGRLNTAEVLIAAELEHRSWGVRRYRARLQPSPHTIVLSE